MLWVFEEIYRNIEFFISAFNSYFNCGFRISVFCKENSTLALNIQLYYLFFSILTAIKSILSWAINLDGFQVIWSHFVISLHGVFSCCNYVFSAGFERGQSCWQAIFQLPELTQALFTFTSRTALYPLL